MSIYYNEGDAIEGDRIACQFRKMHRTILGKGSHAHRGSKTALDDAYCVIEKPFLRIK